MNPFWQSALVADFAQGNDTIHSNKTLTTSSYQLKLGVREKKGNQKAGHMCVQPGILHFLNNIKD